MLRQDDFIKAHLVAIGYNCGKEYGGHLAAVSIMNVLSNRARLGWGTWLDVLNNVQKYAAEDLPSIILPSIWDINFVRLLTEVEGAYDGSGRDYSNGAIYWCDLRRINNEWFREEIIRSGRYEACSNMNSLTFYRPNETLNAVEHAARYSRQ